MSDSATTTPTPEVIDEEPSSSELVERAHEIVSAPAARPDYALAIEMGRQMAQSGYFADAKEQAQAAVKMIIGFDLGISPTAAMSAIHIVEGKPMIGYQIIAAKILQHPHYGYEVLTHHDEACEVVFTDNRKGTPADEGDPATERPPRLANEIGRVDWTIERAKGIGLVKDKSGWARYPRNMLFARCLSDGVKWYLPDLLVGAAVYVDDEIPEGRRELTPSDPNARPAPLADERAEKLRASAREGHAKLVELNPAIMPPGAFAKRLSDVGHSHVELEALVDHVNDLAAVEGQIADQLEELEGEVDADRFAEVKLGLERKRGQRDKLAAVEKAIAEHRAAKAGDDDQGGGEA